MIDNNTIVDMANYLIDNKATIRQCAKEFNISRSYIHVLMHQNLPAISKSLYAKICDLFEYNTQQRAVRGGISTYSKYGPIVHHRWGATNEVKE